MVIGLLSYVSAWFELSTFSANLIVLTCSLLVTGGVLPLTDAPSIEKIERLRDELVHEETE